MMLGVVGSDGACMPPFFFEKNPEGGGINQDTYLQAMEQHVYPWIQRTYEDLDVAYIFQQDGASGINNEVIVKCLLYSDPILAHTGDKTQSWMQDNLEDYMTKDEWPPNSADLGSNSMHFKLLLLTLGHFCEAAIKIISLPNYSTIELLLRTRWITASGPSWPGGHALSLTRVLRH